MITFVRTNGPANSPKATKSEKKNESDLGFRRRKPKRKTDLENESEEKKRIGTIRRKRSEEKRRGQPPARSPARGSGGVAYGGGGVGKVRRWRGQGAAV